MLSPCLRCWYGTHAAAIGINICSSSTTTSLSLCGRLQRRKTPFGHRLPDAQSVRRGPVHRNRQPALLHLKTLRICRLLQRAIWRIKSTGSSSGWMKVRGRSALMEESKRHLFITGKAGASKSTLPEIPCGTVEQMKLVNTFCWSDEYENTNKEVC